MLVTNRHGTSDSYRYGFQGQEKDDEIKGEGNSYDFGGSGLDVRIGRRWNLDPVLKPFQSGYITFGNDPISRIDHDGNDDIFYMKNGIMHFAGTKNGIAIKVLTNHGLIDITKLSFDIKVNRTIVTNIFAFYGKQIAGEGTYGTVSKKEDKNAKDNPAYSSGKSIFLNIKGGLDEDLNDYRNLENVIAHEKYHKEAKGILKTFGDHAMVYAKQFKDDTFINTTASFKEGQLGAVVQYLANGLVGNTNVAPDSKEQIMSIMDKVNTALKNAKGGYQIKFEDRNSAGSYTGEGGDGFFIQKNGKDVSGKMKNNPKMKDVN